MSPVAARRAAAAVVAAVVVLEVATVALTVGEDRLLEAVLYLVYAVVQAGAGALVVHRYPRHRIGWLLVLYALVNAVAADFALAYGVRAWDAGWPLSAGAQLVGMVSWIVAASGLVLLFLLVPDGRFAGPRWRWVVWAWAVGAVLALPAWTFDPRLDGEFAGGVNPFAWDAFPSGPVFAVGAALVAGSLVASVVCLVLRLRRASGRERDQLAWVAMGATIVAVVLPTSAALWTVWPPIQVLAALALVALPVCTCIAILRHRLYDVDTVVVAGAAWLAVALALAAVYVGVTLAAATFVGSPVAAAAGALVVALTFGPVHHAVQSSVDRWFRPARHRAVSSMAAFVTRLREGGASAEELESAFRDALRDDGLTLVLRLPDGEVVDAGGSPATAVGDGRRPVHRIPTVAGVTALVSHRAGDERLVAAVGDAGRLAVEIGALQVQLRRHVREVERSRVRIQSVADEERRRIARDLHDGVQQRLVAVGLALRHAQLDVTRPATVAAIDAAVAGLTESIEELRELAGGLRPGSLDDGLTAALRELAGRTPVPVEVTALPDRFPSHVETAAYFVACEAVTNAVKHGQASRIAVDLSRDDGSLVLTVADDGRGGADLRRGSGLLGLADRVRAHHGQLVVDSPPGAGTRLEARLPCA